MIEEIQRLLDDCAICKTTLRQVDQWVEITTPYVDRHNDCIQIYATKTGTGFVLTDDGYTIQDLEQSGYRQTLLKVGFGVLIRDGALEVHASSDNFALCAHNLVQAILEVNNLLVDRHE